MDEIRFSKYDLLRNVNIPNESEDLSEFLGIIAGDGSFFNKDRVHQIGITLNLTEDKEYANHVITLIKNLFNIQPYVLSRQKYNAYFISIHSKAIADLLVLQNFPNGNKKGKLVIPNWILNKNKFTCAFLRGLMDTDGSVFFAKRGTYKQNKYPVLEIKCSDKNFIEQITNAMKIMGLVSIKRECKDGGFKMQLNGQKQFEIWLKRIGFSNFKHTSKYLVWKNTGFCPPHTTLEERQEILKKMEPGLGVEPN